MLFVAAIAALALVAPAAVEDFPPARSPWLSCSPPADLRTPPPHCGNGWVNCRPTSCGRKRRRRYGMTGSKRVADAAGWLHMILGSVGTHAQNQTLYKHPLYNVVTDFTPVAYSRHADRDITRPDLPANNFKEFIAYAKANQAKMQYGSAGAGSATHLACASTQHRHGHSDRAHSL